ncbi:Uma2 family endonuclease [Aerosakkonema funiforme]|uniref:Uma2 family endonuclease n=1 Tax=Aerosakkonema funiforme FACHB-1375 TaxID=2949571 RepID=A0A926VEI4_9CYAN|nr:Uma2 family endonuclease [Aerosakkonema funiforme]MBD2182425.1 Uma2 family endonuclease [Aerosakkonema funiforme FACHB-1375]
MIATAEVSNVSKIFTLEDYMLNPPDNTEWVDGQLVEKNNITAKHSRTQARLARYWGNYLSSSQQGGEVYTEVSCRTVGRGRCPDVAYLTPELLAQYGDNFTVLPQSFPLIAEIISPTDPAEEVFTKVREYLESGCQEIWLLFPESQWILVITKQQQKLFNIGEVVSTQIVLPGFSVEVNELLA